MTRVKVCGCVSYDDAARALDAGADTVGFIFAESERKISIDTAAEIVARLPPFTTVFGVFVDPDIATVRYAQDAVPGLHAQFSGDEPPAFCESAAGLRYLKALHLGGSRDDSEVVASAGDYPRAVPLFDVWHPHKRGGTGVTFTWSRLAGTTKPPVFAVSGGLTAENVGECVRLLRPNVVDVRSGVETDGRKDPNKMRAFVRAVREADAET
ncbi:MAG: phosphoribosylanthranilate isomerase [Vulcanimicrobiaceae bacterium]